MMKTNLALLLGLTSATCFLLIPQVQGAPKKPIAKKQPKKAALTPEMVKSDITRKEKMLATGIGSVHKSVTLTFESIRFGATRKATMRDKVTNGIDGPIVYPVRVKYISHRVWGNGEKENVKIHYDHEFYKDSYGEWNTYMVGPVRN